MCVCADKDCHRIIVSTALRGVLLLLSSLPVGLNDHTEKNSIFRVFDHTRWEVVALSWFLDTLVGALCVQNGSAAGEGVQVAESHLNEPGYIAPSLRPTDLVFSLVRPYRVPL